MTTRGAALPAHDAVLPGRGGLLCTFACDIDRKHANNVVLEWGDDWASFTVNATAEAVVGQLMRDKVGPLLRTLRTTHGAPRDIRILKTTGRHIISEAVIEKLFQDKCLAVMGAELKSEPSDTTSLPAAAPVLGSHGSAAAAPVLGSHGSAAAAAHGSTTAAAHSSSAAPLPTHGSRADKKFKALCQQLLHTPQKTRPNMSSLLPSAVTKAHNWIESVTGNQGLAPELLEKLRGYLAGFE